MEPEFALIDSYTYDEKTQQVTLNFGNNSFVQEMDPESYQKLEALVKENPDTQLAIQYMLSAVKEKSRIITLD